MVVSSTGKIKTEVPKLMLFSMVLRYVLVRCDQLFSITIRRLLECSILDWWLKVWKCYQKLMVINVNVGLIFLVLVFSSWLTLSSAEASCKWHKRAFIYLLTWSFRRSSTPSHCVGRRSSHSPPLSLLKINLNSSSNVRASWYISTDFIDSL